MFKAIWLEKPQDAFQASLRQLSSTDDLGEGDTIVRVEWSSLNYKDALAITNRGAVIRNFPIVPGIDLAGVVESSESSAWQPGDPVLITGRGYGEVRSGGLSQLAKVSAADLVRVPAGATTRQVMAFGTAGFTAMLAVMRIEQAGLRPADGPVLVTGAAGGVGSAAVALLAALGYSVSAVTGRASEGERLRRLGAAEILPRESFSTPGKPLAKERWAAAIDSVGSHTLANVLAATRYGGVVAACGLAQGMELPATVAPLILRSVTLAGIESVYFPNESRPAIWGRMVELLDAGTLATVASDSVPLDGVLNAANDLLAGRVPGRLLIDLG
ncbi:MAG: oxidoreductase [Pigmentiphaga sp.]|nr:oxidoreductase [Pigmentiphaga sp.]